MRPTDRLAAAGLAWWLVTGVGLATLADGDHIWIVWLMFLSPLVLVPLIAGRLADAYPAAWGWLADSAVPALFLAAAAIAPLSYLLEPGWRAAWLVTPWTICTVLAALAGLRWLIRSDRTSDVWIVAAGLGFVAVGGAWLVVTRLGARPLDFSTVIVLLTAMHFHHAGVVLPVIAGLNLKYGHHALNLAGGWGVVIGTPLTAAGITAGGDAEWATATFMAVAGILVAAGQLRLARHGLGRMLLTISAIALFAGMILAVTWALSQKDSRFAITIDTMARSHGTLNAVGFGLVGLLGWRVRLGQAATR